MKVHILARLVYRFIDLQVCRFTRFQDNLKTPDRIVRLEERIRYTVKPVLSDHINQDTFLAF